MLMPSTVQQKLLDISSLTSKLLRKSFGRGPESCHAFLNKRYLIFYIKGFLSPMETVLLENGNSDNIDISRSIVLKSVLSQLKGVLELEFEQDVYNFYHDWNYPNNTGMITAIFENDITMNTNENIEEFDESTSLINEVSRISQLVEKIPDKINAYRITSKIYLVERLGILVPIEKALISKGFHQTLSVTKDALEKTYVHRDGRFEEIFKQPVVDIFIDWNFHEDNSMMCFVLK